jgi:hypothetical protein
MKVEIDFDRCLKASRLEVELWLKWYSPRVKAPVSPTAKAICLRNVNSKNVRNKSGV